MAATGKDTIYIDIDDEITTIIDKVRASDAKIVALVLPKRANVLQSIVNMKLLKRTADNDKKNLVLITSEAGLMPLAATVGLHVAKSLQSKPEIPTLDGEDGDDSATEDVDGPEDDEVTNETAGNRPVGELAAAGGAAVAAASKDEGIETLDMDDDGAEADESDDGSEEPAPPSKAKKSKKLAIPNFNKFRMLLLLGGALLIVLIVGIIVAASVLPKAQITLTTDTSDINSSLTLNLDTGVKALDAAKLTLPATLQQSQKSGSQQVSTTGKVNNGTKASGSVTLSLPDCSVSQVTVPTGTGVSSGGFTFITQADATLQSVKVGSQCKNSSFPTFSTATVAVVAQGGGANYNIAAGNFTVAGYSGVSASSGSAMTGGTDNIIQTVTQSDIDSATQKIAAANTDSIKQQLEQQLQQAGLFAIADTFTAGTPATTSSSNVGDQATTVTVTTNTTYTMFGVKQSDLKTLVDNDVKGQIDSSKQSILSEGLSNATFHVNNANATTAQIAMSTVATAGPDLKADTIKSEATGKKSGDVVTMLKSDPGVTEVNVKLSPFWVNKVPKVSKITVVFQKAAK